MFQTKLKATITLFLLALTLGSYALMVRANASPKPAATVLQTPDFTISVSPTFAARKRGTGELYIITIQAVNGFNGTVNFTVTGLFPGASIPIPPAPVTGSGQSSFDLLTQHPPTTPQGTFTLTITGKSGTLSHSAQTTIQML